MGEITGISWTDHTFSPWFGCTKISEACRHCYSESDNARYKRNGTGTWGPGAPRVRSKGWDNPRRWNRAAAKAGRTEKVFPSLCDPFDREVSAEWRADFGQLIRETPSLIWLLLSKRPGDFEVGLREMFGGTDEASIPRNVWLGVSVEDQQTADERIPLLLRWPVSVRFLSLEPLLGPVDLFWYVQALNEHWTEPPSLPLKCQWLDGCTGTVTRLRFDIQADLSSGRGWMSVCDVHTGISWVITGGESGAHARPSHPDWFRSVRDQCVAAGVAFQHKQNGEWASALGTGCEFLDVESKPKVWMSSDGTTRPVGQALDMPTDELMIRVGKKAAGRLLDGVEWSQFPTRTEG